MATQIQYRRGNQSQNDAFTGALGEITVDTTNKTLRVHDGATVGGNTVVTTYATQTLSFKTLSAPTITGTLSSTGFINTTANISAAILNSGAINSTGFINTTANISAAIGLFGSLTSTGFINTSGNVSAATVLAGALTSTGFINTSGNVSAATVLAGQFNTTGNILSTGASIFGNARLGLAGQVSGAFHTVVGNITQSTSGGAVYINTSGNVMASIGQFGSINSTGFINTSGNVSAAIGSFDSITVRAAVTAIANGGTSGVGNIGATGATFNTVFARATTAQYADLAEIYTSDQQYPGGTVVVFGGEAEVTQSHSPHDTRIAGVVSTQPAYLMNHDAVGVPVALQGRVPCRVLGPVSKGDRVVSSHIPGVAQVLDPGHYEPGCIIGKALQAIDSAEISIIEVVVGRV